MKEKLDIELVKRLYVDDRKTCKEVGDSFGVNHQVIRRVLINSGVKLRGKGSCAKRSKPPTQKQEVKDVDRMVELFNQCVPVNEMSKELNVGRKAIYRKIKELGLVRPKSMMSREQYDDSKDAVIVEMYNNGVPPREIAEKIGLSRAAIRLHLKHCGVDTRNISKGLFNANGKEFPKELEDFDTLYDMYVTQRLSKKEIGNLLSVAPHVVDRCLKKFGIHVRGDSEAKSGLFVGDKHPNWKGGRSGLYMRLREQFRLYQVKEIVKRDGGRCQLCGSKKRLHVHHIRPFKDIFDEILSEHQEMDVMENEQELFDIMIADKRFNDPDNLITYCKECHLFKVHGYVQGSTKLRKTKEKN